MYKVETNVPVPSRSRYALKYPWNDMTPGASFFVPNAPSNLLSANASRVGKQRGWQFICRKVDGGVRVWRIA